MSATTTADPPPPAEAPWPREKVSVLAFSAFALGMMAGVSVFAALDDSRDYGPLPVELTAEERAAPVIHQKLHPMEMRLRVISREQFVKEIGGTAITGFTRSGSLPCEITIPADMEIAAVPREGYARWTTNTGEGDLFAHEILHCIRGSWHPAWSEILKQKG